LAAAFTARLKETEGQINRLEEVAKLLDTTPTGKKCKGMEGVVEEGAEALADSFGAKVFLDKTCLYSTLIPAIKSCVTVPKKPLPQKAKKASGSTS